MKDNIINDWQRIVQFTLTVFGLITVVGYFVAYYIVTSYITEIQFSTGSIDTHILFSIVKNVVLFYGSLFIIIMYGSFFSYKELSKNENRAVMKRFLLTSSLMVFLLHALYFGVSYIFNLDLEQTTILLFSLLVGITLIGYFVLKRISDNQDYSVIFWQMLNSLVATAFLLFIIMNTNLDWSDVILVVISSVVINSYPYLFVLGSSKSWVKYGFISIIIFSLILFTVAPNVLKEISIRNAQVGGVPYKSIKITNEECEYINKYYKNKPCKENILANVKGLWLQGSIHLFENIDRNERYKIKSDNIISKIRIEGKIVKMLSVK
jgi:hypothetical protein